MNQHKQILLRGIALGLGFVGVWGFAIDASQWVTLISLITASVLLWVVSYKKEKK